MLAVITRPNNHVALVPIENSALPNRFGRMQNIFTELGQHLTTEQWMQVQRTQQQRCHGIVKGSVAGKLTYGPRDPEILPAPCQGIQLAAF